MINNGGEKEKKMTRKGGEKEGLEREKKREIN